MYVIYMPHYFSGLLWWLRRGYWSLSRITGLREETTAWCCTITGTQFKVSFLQFLQRLSCGFWVITLNKCREYEAAVQELSICMAFAPEEEAQVLEPFVERLHLMRLEKSWKSLGQKGHLTSSLTWW